MITMAFGLATEMTAVGRKTLSDLLCNACQVFVREFYHGQMQRFCKVCRCNLHHAESKVA